MARPGKRVRELLRKERAEAKAARARAKAERARAMQAALVFIPTSLASGLPVKTPRQGTVRVFRPGKRP